MKILVLGDGSAGRRHAGHLVARGHEVKVIGPQEDSVGHKPLEWKPEGVVVSTPPEYHKAALEYWTRSHILCEGPCTFLPEPSPRAVRMMASNWRFVPKLKDLKERLRQPLLASFWFDYDLAKWRAGIDYKKTCYYWSGHDLINVHEVDMAFWFFGPAERVQVEKIFTGKSRACDGFQMQIRHRSGVVSSISSSWHAAQYLRGYQIISKDGSVEEGSWTTPVDDPTVNTSYEAVIDHWLDAIDKGAPLVEPSLEDGFRAYEALQGRVF